MIRRAPALAALLVALVLPSGAALAKDEYEDPEQTLEKSMYLQLGGQGNFDLFGATTGQNSGGINIRAGLRSASWMAIEAQFEWVHGMEPDGNRSGDDWTTTFNWRVYPLTDLILKGRIQPFLVMGIGATSYKLNEPSVPRCLGNYCPDKRYFGFSSRWGGGVDVYVTDKIGIVLDCTYVWATGTPIKDLNYVSLGLGAIYRFY
jgi:hypothetical protein